MIKTHHRAKLRTLDNKEIAPGSQVMSIGGSGQGIVIGVTAEGITVMWSTPPISVDVEVQEINAPSRPLRAKWSVSEEEPVYGGSSSLFSKTRPMFEGEEEYGPGELDRGQVEAIMAAGATDVVFHQDGTVIVKRRSDAPPEYLRDENGQFRRSTYRR